MRGLVDSSPFDEDPLNSLGGLIYIRRICRADDDEVSVQENASIR
jgi:hypothetical protein